MAEYKICFDVAGEFGAQISFEAKAGVSYEDAAASIDKDKLAKALCLSALGYSADDIEVITPEQYEAKYTALSSTVWARHRRDLALWHLETGSNG